jgi:uncharacterized protein HemY
MMLVPVVVVVVVVVPLLLLLFDMIDSETRAIWIRSAKELRAECAQHEPQLYIK